MTIKIGDPLPDAPLSECLSFGDACGRAPSTISACDAAGGKTVVIVGLIGAFTDDCAEKHVPGYLALYDDLKAAGVDEIWCVAVNDGFAMGAFGEALSATGKLRMLGDGNGEFARALGLDIDLSFVNMGTRMNRCSLLAKDGIVVEVNVEEPMALAVSDAATMLSQVHRL